MLVKAWQPESCKTCAGDQAPGVSGTVSLADDRRD